MVRTPRGRDVASDAVLPVRSRGEIPLREVSGLAVGPGPGGRYLVAVGDRGPEVAYTQLEGDGLAGAGDWLTIDLSDLPAPPGAPRVEQAEAIAMDGAGGAVVLIEDPPLLLLLDVGDRRLVAAYELDAGTVDELASSWAHDANSRGEGIVLLRGGHVLVVKEKRPAGLVEFGPPGATPIGISDATLLGAAEPWRPPASSRLTALAWWPGDDGLDDFSDAAVGPDGGLYLLSDQSGAIGRVAMPLRVGEARGILVRRWDLDSHIDKAEGLAFLPDGSAVVAVDHPGKGRNLARLPPLDQWPPGHLIRPR